MRAFLATMRCGFLLLAGSALTVPGTAQQPSKPYKVRVVEEKIVFTEKALPVNPNVLVRYAYSNNMDYQNLKVGSRALVNHAGTVFMIDDQIHQPKVANKLEELPDSPHG